MEPSMCKASGSIKKRVTCESCRHEYEYEMSRTADGSFWGFAMTKQEADEKAALDAAEKLKALLERDWDVVPCPKCGTLTREMQRPKTDFIPLSFSSIGLGALLAGWAYLEHESTGRWRYGFGILGVALLLLGMLLLFAGTAEMLLGRSRKGKRINWSP